MMYRNKQDFKMRYNVGDIVQVKEDLSIGALYSNKYNEVEDEFTYGMKKYCGKNVKIVSIQYGRYQVEFEGIETFYNFTEGMFVNDSEDYDFVEEVEYILIDLEIARLENLIDHSLDIKDKSLFIEYSNRYNKLKEKKEYLEKVY